jgi:hypothetical protein
MIADCLHGLGDHQQARALDEDTLARRRRVLGDDAPPAPSARRTTSPATSTRWRMPKRPVLLPRMLWPAIGRPSASITSKPSPWLSASLGCCMRWVSTSRPAASWRTRWPAPAVSSAKTTPTPGRRPKAWRSCCGGWTKLPSSGPSVSGAYSDLTVPVCGAATAGLAGGRHHGLAVAAGSR